MATLDRLIRDARLAGQLRGHTPRRFTRNYPSAQARADSAYAAPSAYSECDVCGADVSVHVRPMPNGIDIGGPMVAIGCASRDYYRAMADQYACTCGIWIRTRADADRHADCEDGS